MTVLLLSGGLDSLAAWRLLGLPRAIHFTLGTRAADREVDAIHAAEVAFGAAAEVRPLPLGHAEMPNGYLPLRNPLLVLAAAQLDPDVIVGQVAEWAPDKSARFWWRLSRLATTAVRGSHQGVSGRVTVRAPMRLSTKGQLLRRYAARFGDQEARALCAFTWSCYGDGGQHCGACSGCAQRYAAEVWAFGAPETAMARVPDLRVRPTEWRDAARWVRDNPTAGPVQMWRRSRELRTAKAATT